MSPMACIMPRSKTFVAKVLTHPRGKLALAKPACGRNRAPCARLPKARAPAPAGRPSRKLADFSHAFSARKKFDHRILIGRGRQPSSVMIAPGNAEAHAPERNAAARGSGEPVRSSSAPQTTRNLLRQKARSSPSVKERRGRPNAGGKRDKIVAGTLAEDAKFTCLRIGDRRRVGGQQALRNPVRPLHRGTEIIFPRAGKHRTAQRAKERHASAEW